MLRIINKLNFMNLVGFAITATNRPEGESEAFDLNIALLDSMIRINTLFFGGEAAHGYDQVQNISSSEGSEHLGIAVDENKPLIDQLKAELIVLENQAQTLKTKNSQSEAAIQKLKAGIERNSEILLIIEELLKEFRIKFDQKISNLKSNIKYFNDEMDSFQESNNGITILEEQLSIFYSLKICSIETSFEALKNELLSFEESLKILLS